MFDEVPISQFDYKVFVGIDQTGATDKNGVPKPLHVSVIDCRQKKAKYHTALKLKSLNAEAIQQLLQSTVGILNGERVLICVDSVLGLPAELKIPAQKIRVDAGKYSYSNKKYGAVTAYQFFRSYLKPESSSQRVPSRIVELQVKANSVFNLRPFQKNIGCGSYRILRDLSQGEQWFCIWPFEPLVKQITIAEGYPSYFWKKHLQSRTRNIEVLKAKFKDLKFETMDQADSFVLALGASKDFTQVGQRSLPKQIRIEGWILGVNYEPSVNF